MSSRSETITDGDPEFDAPIVRGHQDRTLTQSAGWSRATPRSRLPRRSRRRFADRVAATRDRNAAALILHQAALLSEAAAGAELGAAEARFDEILDALGESQLPGGHDLNGLAHLAVP